MLQQDGCVGPCLKVRRRNGTQVLLSHRTTRRQSGEGIHGISQWSTRRLFVSGTQGLLAAAVSGTNVVSQRTQAAMRTSIHVDSFDPVSRSADQVRQPRRGDGDLGRGRLRTPGGRRRLQAALRRSHALRPYMPKVRGWVCCTEGWVMTAFLQHAAFLQQYLAALPVALCTCDATDDCRIALLRTPAAAAARTAPHLCAVLQELPRRRPRAPLRHLHQALQPPAQALRPRLRAHLRRALRPLHAARKRAVPAGVRPRRAAGRAVLEVSGARARLATRPCTTAVLRS